MDIENKFEIIANHHQKLLTRYHSIGTTIASLTADSCIDAKEYWRDGKYLYLLYSMKSGVRRKKYVGSHPLRIKEARQSIENFKDRLYHIEVQENVKSSLDEIEKLTQQILQICGASGDMSARYASIEQTNGYKDMSAGNFVCTQKNNEPWVQI